MNKKTSKRKHASKSRLSRSVKRELYAIIFFLLALFFLVTNKYNPSTGFVGYWLQTFLVRLVGEKGAAFLPLFFVLPGVSLLCAKASGRQIALAVLGCFTCFTILLENMYYVHPFLNWKSPSEVGGWLGMVGAYFLDHFIGELGTYLFIFGVFVLSAVLVFGFSVKTAIKNGWRVLETVAKMRKKWRSKMQRSLRGRRVQRASQRSRQKWPGLLRVLFYKRKRVIIPTRCAAPESLSELKQEDTSKFDMPELLPFSKTVSEANPSMDDAKLEHDEPEHDEAALLEDESASEKVAVTTNGATDALSVKKRYQLPPMFLLRLGKRSSFDKKDIARQKQKQGELLRTTLESFNVEAKVVNITIGPSVTRYEIEPGNGVKISKITMLSQDIALKLAASDIRIAPVAGKALIGIEVPNYSVDTITLRMIMDQTHFQNQVSKILAVLGLTITGESVLMDLGKMPHVLIAGSTGSGKSVCINAIILSILMKARPDEVKFLMIDPKKVELSLYEGIPHLLAPVVTNPHKAAATLKKWALLEMENRYEVFAKVGVKDIEGYNKYASQDKTTEKMPFIVVIIDELADLMMVASMDVEQTICRLAQMARATGIHLVIATQRPSVNVVTGLIKANIPSRLSFFLQSQIDSRTILDMPGAEKLLGKGDMLYSPVGSFKPTRIQGVFVSEAEVKGVVSWLKKQAVPEYVDQILELENTEETSEPEETGKDALFDDAKQLVMTTKYASTSYLQRKLKIGYNRAARIMDELEESGVISEYAGEKKSRQVL